MSQIQVPSGSLVERLAQVAALHERNAAMCAPAFTTNRAALETANRHMRIHEIAAETILEALSILTNAKPSNPNQPSRYIEVGDEVSRHST